MRVNTEPDAYIGRKYTGRSNNSGQSSRMARIGQLNVSEDFKPHTMGHIRYGDSISNFQSELERMAERAQKKADKRYRQRSKKVYTEKIIQEPFGDTISKNFGPSYPRNESSELTNELSQIKRLIEEQSKVSSVESRLDRMLSEMEKKREVSYHQPPIHPNYFYPPPMYPPPTYYNHRRSPSEDLYSEEQRPMRRPRKPPTLMEETTQSLKPKSKNVVLPKNKNASRLKKFFYAVAFVSFLKKDSIKMARARKQNLKKFWLQKFDCQVLNLKNWLLEGLKYSLSIILEKRELNFDFFDEKRQKVKEEKEKLVLKLVFLLCEQLKKLSNPRDVSLFSEILTILCRNGSFPISRFWTVHEMQNLHISEYYGFIRATKQTQMYLIGVFVFIKMLIFNMLLQPFKFDSVNFQKNKEPLITNMYIIASLMYHAVCEVIEELNRSERHPMFEGGNWLDVKKEYITECCEPLKYKTNKLQNGEYISGMIIRENFDDMLDFAENEETWVKIKRKIREILQNLHKEMKSKSKMMKGNLKYKMYN